MGIAEACGKLLGEAVDLLASTGAAVKDTVSATTAYARDLVGPQPVVLGDSPRPVGALASIAACEPNAELQAKLKEAEERFAQMATLEQELEFSEQQRAEASQQAAVLQQQLRQAGKAVEAARAEVSSLKARRNEIEDARHALAAEVRQLHDVSLRLDVLEEEHTAALKEVEQARAVREELNAELEQLTEVNKAQEAQLAQQQQLIATLRKTVKQLTERVELSEGERKQLKASLKARCGEIEDARHALTAEVLHLREVSLRLDVLEEEHAATIKELEEARAACKELNAELEQLTEANKAQEAQLAQQQPAVPKVSVESRTAGGKRVAMQAEQAAGEVQREPEGAEPAPPGDADAASEPAITATGHEAPDGSELSALERTMARHADGRARLRALQAIYATADRPTVLANLVRALSDSSPVIRRTAVTCLGLMAAQEALPELHSVADDPDVSVRKAYARALASLGGDGAVQPHLRPDSSRHIPSSHSTLATACWQQVLRARDEKLSQAMKKS